MTPLEKFNSTAPWVMALLMTDFQFTLDDTAAAVGNGGHESNGLQAINEKNPTVKGSRGGFSWFQWTGSRRTDFENYCRRNNYDPASDMAAYKWLFVELTTTEKNAVAATKAAVGLEAKVEAFEAGYERAGVKHYPSRVEWARRALQAWAMASDKDKLPPWERETGGAAPRAPEPAAIAPVGSVAPATTPATTPPPPVDPSEVSKNPVSKANGAAGGAAAGTAGVLTVGGALVFILSSFGYIPKEIDSLTLGLAVGTIVTGTANVITSWIGAFRAKRNPV